MLQNSIDNFFESASMKMPDVVTPSMELRNKREVYFDNAVVALALKRPLTVSKFIDKVDSAFGMVMMYHHVRSRDTEFGQSICFFQEPGTGSISKLMRLPTVKVLSQKSMCECTRRLKRWLPDCVISCIVWMHSPDASLTKLKNMN